MNTTIEYILYGIGIVILIAVPLALIAGGLASRSVVVPPETGDDCAAVCVTKRKSHLAPGNQTGEPPNGTSPSDSKP